MNYLIEKKIHSGSEYAKKPLDPSFLQDVEKVFDQRERGHLPQVTITRVSTKAFLKHLKENYPSCHSKSSSQSKKKSTRRS